MFIFSSVHHYRDLNVIAHHFGCLCGCVSIVIGLPGGHVGASLWVFQQRDWPLPGSTLELLCGPLSIVIGLVKK